MSFREIERVDERGVWLTRGRAALEPISDAFAGPIEAYRAAAEASPILEWTGFDPPATAAPHGGGGRTGHDASGDPEDGPRRP